MNQTNNDYLTNLYKKLESISRETSEALDILKQILNIDNSKYNPDEYLKKWINGADIQTK